jgi:hypothetical protein
VRTHVTRPDSRREAVVDSDASYCTFRDRHVIRPNEGTRRSLSDRMMHLLIPVRQKIDECVGSTCSFMSNFDKRAHMHKNRRQIEENHPLPSLLLICNRYLSLEPSEFLDQQVN